MSHDESILASSGELEPANAGARWLSSPLLEEVPRLVHGFTLRVAGDFTRPEPARELTRLLGATALRLLQQVHGTALAAPDDPGLPVADGWVGASSAGVVLAIRTADCLPLLFCHPASRTLGLAHAGWRGAVAGIASKTLKQMNVPAEEILVALGPAIGPCCYEVGEEVAAGAGGSPHVVPTGPQRYGFNLPGYVRTQLLEAGVLPNHLNHVELCTACRTDLLFSYRAEATTARLCSFLGWSGP